MEENLLIILLSIPIIVVFLYLIFETADLLNLNKSTFTDFIEFLKKLKLKKEMGFHSIKKSELPDDTKSNLLHRCFDYIEDYQLPSYRDIDYEDYKHLKILQSYCKENNVNCELPAVIDDVIDNQKILEWLINNKIFTEKQFKEHYKNCTKPDFSVDEFFLCKNKEIRHYLNPKWYLDSSKIKELKTLLKNEITDNNFNILRCNNDVDTKIVRFDFQFRNITDNVIKFQKLRKEINDVLVRLYTFHFCDNDELDNDNNLIDFIYWIYDKKVYEVDNHIDSFEIPIDSRYQSEVEELNMYPNSIMRADILKACSNYYSENENRSLLLDTYDFIPTVTKGILAELNR